MSTDLDIVRMAAGANAVTVVSSGDGITMSTPGASIQVTGQGEILMAGEEPVTKNELDDAIHAGEPITVYPGEAQLALPMRHATWAQVDPGTGSVAVTPASAANSVSSMQLLLTPAADMSAGWLTSTDPALPVLWPYGEPPLAGGFRYCVTLVQMPWAILANMTPLGAQPTA